MEQPNQYQRTTNPTRYKSHVPKVKKLPQFPSAKKTAKPITSKCKSASTNKHWKTTSTNVRMAQMTVLMVRWKPPPSPITQHSSCNTILQTILQHELAPGIVFTHQYVYVDNVTSIDNNMFIGKHEEIPMRYNITRNLQTGPWRNHLDNTNKSKINRLHTNITKTCPYTEN